MEQDEGQKQLAVSIQLSPVDQQYYYFNAQLQFSEDLSKLLVNQTYFFFVIELRTGIRPNDLPKIVNYFLLLSEEIINKEIRGISFIINGQHHPIQNFTIQAIKQLFSETFLISKEDDYSVTLTRTRHAIQSVAQKLNQTNITLLFFFSHIEIDHTLGVKKRSYINKLNQHAEICWDEVNKLSKAVRRFTQKCKTYIISYDKEGEQEEDYSLCDTDLMNQIVVKVGRNGTLTRNYSYNQLGESFEQASALMLYKMYSLDLLVPVFQNQDTFQPFSELLSLSCQNSKDFRGKPIFIKRQLLDSVALREKGLEILKPLHGNINPQELQGKLNTVHFKANVNYCELPPSKLIVSRCNVACLEISNICRVLSKKIVTYKRRYEGGKSYIDMEFDKEMFLELRDRVENHYEQSKSIFNSIREGGFKGKEQFQLYEGYNQLKRKIDNTRDILVGILKKQIGGSQIGKLSQVINLSSIKNSLKNKLLKRINANPFLLDQVYDKVREVVNHGQINFPQLEVDQATLRSNLGNCVISDYNFVKAMLNYDALGVAFEIERSMSAIADPGRLRIRQVSPSLIRVSSFFQKFLYRIEYTPQTVQLVLGRCRYCRRFCDKYCDDNHVILSHLEEAKVHSYKMQQKKVEYLNQWNQSVSANTFDSGKVDKEDIYYRNKTQIDYLRDVGDLNKHNYQEKWDYTNRVQSTQSVLGFMPLFLTQQHWRIAKQLMKPCLAFTATGEPLGYLFAQYQTIPFMLLSAIIKTVKQFEYSLEEDNLTVQAIKGEAELNKLQAIINRKKLRLTRFKHLQQAIEITCKMIMDELSSPTYQLPFDVQIRQKYFDYKEPINRTVDVISNNSCFLGQIYTAFKFEFMVQPKEEDFHHFFVRLIQEELRRETEAWVEQQTQDAFVNKILNLDIEKIKKSQNSIIVVTEQDYISKFYQALQGYRQQEKMIQIHKQQLQMMLRKQGKFNDNQRLLITEYQRMYINRVMWMWYIRFLLYAPLDKIFIRRWKSLGITNSYMLFTLIIQNKKQTKNYKRREAIIQGRYVDPFDYYQAREYLESQFTELYNKTLNSMKKEVEYKKASGATEVFAMAGNLDEAAGVVLDADAKFIRKIYEALCQKNVPLFADKLGMLVHGVHRGVRIKKWIPGKKKMNHLRNCHQYEFQCSQYKF